jgi:zinc protease
MIRRLAVLLAFVLATLPAQAAMKVQRVVSPGGIEAWLVEDHANPVIALGLAFRGGSALDPVGKEGLARLVAGLLDEGAGDMDSQAFQGRLDDLAISLGFDASHDRVSGHLRTLTENRDEAFRLLRQALSRPRFDPEPVERVRGQLAAMIRQESTRPSTVAERALMEKLFAGHAYARPVKGTLDSLRAIAVADLRAFAAGRLGRDNLVVGVAGDIAPADLARLLDETFGSLPAVSRSRDVPEAKPAAIGTQVIDMAVPQSSILFAQPGLMRRDPDFYAAYVLNHILGGGSFSSRLYREVREKRGLAYSVGSYLAPMDHAALWAGSVGTANERADETVAIVREEWRRIAAEGVTARELEEAKTYLIGSFPLRFSSSERIAGMLVQIHLDDLGIDYLEKRNGYMAAVTLEQVNDLARRLLVPDALSFVVVGRPNGLR